MSMNMRQQFTATVTALEEKDERVILLLNDIGVWAFRHLKEAYPNRVHNIGAGVYRCIGRTGTHGVCSNLSYDSAFYRGTWL